MKTLVMALVLAASPAREAKAGAAFRALLRAAAGRHASRGDWFGTRDDFARSEAAPALAEEARAAGTSEGRVLREASRGSSLPELDDLYAVSQQLPQGVRDQLVRLAPHEAARQGLSDAERAFWHVLAGDGVAPPPRLCEGFASPSFAAPTLLFDACQHADERSTDALDGLLAAKDRRRLDAYMKNPKRALAKRLLAATYLLQLGDERGFPILEKMLVAGTPEAELRPLAESTLEFTKVPEALKERFDRLYSDVVKADGRFRAQRQQMNEAVTVQPGRH